jgi:hypothetical protein
VPFKIKWRAKRADENFFFSAALRLCVPIFFGPKTQETRGFRGGSTFRAQFENWKECTGVPSRCQANWGKIILEQGI